MDTLQRIAIFLNQCDVTNNKIKKSPTKKILLPETTFLK